MAVVLDELLEESRIRAYFIGFTIFGTRERFGDYAQSILWVLYAMVGHQEWLVATAQVEIITGLRTRAFKVFRRRMHVTSRPRQDTLSLQRDLHSLTASKSSTAKSPTLLCYWWCP